eukprot:4636508-Pyramimonas_sp.AAC.1
MDGIRKESTRKLNSQVTRWPYKVLTASSTGRGTHLWCGRSPQRGLLPPPAQADVAVEADDWLPVGPRGLRSLLIGPPGTDRQQTQSLRSCRHFTSFVFVLSMNNLVGVSDPLCLYLQRTIWSVFHIIRV